MRFNSEELRAAYQPGGERTGRRKSRLPATRLLALHLNVAAGYRSGIGIGNIGPVHVDGEGLRSRAWVAVIAGLHERKRRDP